MNYFNTKNYKMVTLQIPMTNNWNWYVGDFLESFIWLSMDHSKDNFRNNYFI